MKGAVVVASMVSALVLAQSASAASCLKSGVPVSGSFAWVDAKHILNGTPIHAPFVILKHPVCVNYKSDYVKGARVQLVLQNRAGAKSLKEGAHITIVGNYEPPMTPWDIGDIIAFDAKIVRVERS